VTDARGLTSLTGAAAAEPWHKASEPTDGRTFLPGVLPVNDQRFGLLTFDADHDGPEYKAVQFALQPAGAEAPGGETALAWSA
jgi:hypothetical protein